MNDNVEKKKDCIFLFIKSIRRSLILCSIFHLYFRYRLMGWPPRWVRDHPDSKSNNQRALPPVPSSGNTDAVPIQEERVSTPELRPEDFPPGVAYLPDGDDDEEPLEFGSKSNIIDFTASIEAVKNVKSNNFYRYNILNLSRNKMGFVFLYG